MDEVGYVGSFAFQVVPIWVVLPVLVALGLGVWKLAKLVLAALAD